MTNKELPNNLEFPPLVYSLGDFHETNKKRLIQFEAKILQNDVFISVEKTPENPQYFHH